MERHRYSGEYNFTKRLYRFQSTGDLKSYKTNWRISNSYSISFKGNNGSGYNIKPHTITATLLLSIARCSAMKDLTFIGV